MRSLFAVIAIAFVFTSALGSSGVQAQSMLEIAAGIKFCKTLTDDAQRLKCFDGLFTEKQARQPAPAQSQPAMSWEIEESKSPVDDSPQVSGILHADDSGAMPVTLLMLRCKERKTDVMFAKQFQFLGSTDTLKVLVRINDGKPIETLWHPSTNGQAAFAPAAVQFIRALPDDGKLFIRATAFDGTTVDGAFTLGKVSEVRDKIATACHWSGTATTVH
jgi:Type VI secretion system VasI, EvfG, VC_A0118